MNALSTAERGYLQHATSTRSNRRTEYEIVARVTHRLRNAASQSKVDYPGYVAALDENRKLWQLFSIDVADPNNSLPEDLRASLFFLGEFTETHTQRILKDGVSVLPLLEVNMAILRGLKEKVSDQ